MCVYVCMYVQVGTVNVKVGRSRYVGMYVCVGRYVCGSMSYSENLPVWTTFAHCMCGYNKCVRACVNGWVSVE